MKIKQKIAVLIISVLAVTGVVAITGSPAFAKECAGAETSIISCDAEENAGEAEESGVWALLILVLNIMTAGVGILSVAGIVYGAVLYASAGDSAEQTQKAKEIIRNVVIGIVAFAFMFVGLNYLIPGGIFNVS